MNEEGLERLAYAIAGTPVMEANEHKGGGQHPGAHWSEQAKAALSLERLEWPGGSWSRPIRAAYLALLEITGKPSTAMRMMDELELWIDERRPPETIVTKWNFQWRQGGLPIPPKIMDRVQRLYDGRRKSDMDDTLRKANEAHRHISQTVIDNTFDKNTSGALQHLGQIITFGTEKRQIAFEPRGGKDGQQITPTFVLMPPPERRSLPSPAIEGEVREVDGR